MLVRIGWPRTGIDLQHWYRKAAEARLASVLRPLAKTEQTYTSLASAFRTMPSGSTRRDEGR